MVGGLTVCSNTKAEPGKITSSLASYINSCSANVRNTVKEFAFEAAHRLPGLPAEHKCSRLHGHSFKITVYVEGDVDPEFGWVIDFGDIKSAVKPIIDRLDHFYLNEIIGPVLPPPFGKSIECGPAITTWSGMPRGVRPIIPPGPERRKAI